ncbi:MAG: carbamoyl-phosphate synthase large subunit [Elusimicrobia bacterium]|nr:carbamoyl-phosphate synthase large subunit [Elusimicrobiota bacterium]
MPKRTDIQKILIIGSGPIVIGQACEFDYSGTQACKALKDEGYTVILVNSNPATIMTDPAMADRTYIEPLTPEFLEKIIEQERPQAILPTMGGQTALNLAVSLHERGALERYGVELIGANIESIRKAEDRELFKETMLKIGLDLPRSIYIQERAQADEAAKELGFPLIIRPSFTLGGTGGGIAYHLEDLRQKVTAALDLSPVRRILLEESVIGWKEYELEVMRDRKDNVMIVCSIENFDPMGIHTGDSITVAPAQTLTDRQYQEMRNESLAAMRAIGVDTGGSNIQFAVDPKTGRRVIIEMNPRVSRSSALASKATGFPIAKFAAKLAVGYTLDEIPNDITRKTPACFEPAIDYVVTKVPRFDFAKFLGSTAILDTSMKSVGEVMAIGRTFKESLQKALRGLEISRMGLEKTDAVLSADELEKKLALPNPGRVFHIRTALERGISVEDIAELTRIDPWFLHQIQEIVSFEKEMSSKAPLTREVMSQAKRLGFSDAQLATGRGISETKVRAIRKKQKVIPTYKLVDTCAAEFEAYTPYYYSTYESEDEGRLPPHPTLSPKKGERKKVRGKVVILGGGPNRIGQGIEFDYCCVHGVMALREMGYQSIMVNCNPETVSTDYDISDRLYFESLTLEDVLNIVDQEKPLGVIVQFGGQTPLNLTAPLREAGVKILGTSPRSIDMAEDRQRFSRLLKRLKIPAPEHGIARSFAEARRIASRIGYPVLLRPSYVLGGRAMQVVFDESSLEDYVSLAAEVSQKRPLLIDRFLSEATEVDVDAVCDGKTIYVGGVLEHIEEAGIHSGDSGSSLPPHYLTARQMEMILLYTERIAKALKVQGLINLQLAIKDSQVYLLEVNPRASRTVPFVSKATGVPLAKLAAKIMLGKKLETLLPKDRLGPKMLPLPYTCIKEVTLPFLRFPGVDPLLGPEMKSTGEVMGIDTDFSKALAKARAAAGMSLPTRGTVFISVRDEDKPEILSVARALKEWGFQLVATKNTFEFLKRMGVEAQRIYKIGEGKPDVVDWIKQKNIQLIINTPSGSQRARTDGYAIRRNSLEYNIPQITNIHAAKATLNAVAALRGSALSVKALQDYYGEN